MIDIFISHHMIVMLMTMDSAVGTELGEGMADIKDLSFTDIFILQYLQRFQGPIVRIVLLNTLNSFMKGSEMSPSSFYNRLKRLKKKGFIIQENDRSRDQMVKITPLANEALARISMMSMTGSIDFHQHTLELIPKVVQELPELAEAADKLLIINLEEGIDVNTFNEFTRFATSIYIASDDEVHQRYLGRGLNEKIEQSPIENDVIREPASWFDRILIIGLECNTSGKDDREWLEEAYRLLKDDGLLVVTSLAEIPEADHFILNKLVQDLKENKYTKFSNEMELREQLQHPGFEGVDMRNFDGQIIAWARK